MTLDLFAPPPPSEEEEEVRDHGPLTVSEITSQVKALLEETLPACWVVGELSDFSRAASGHCYLTLTDPHSQLSAVMFRSYAQQLSFAPEAGTKVLAFGNISVYERGGRYQFLVYEMRPAGVGELALAFEKLRARLDQDGLFDPQRKRPLPAFPQTVGVVTSRTGAAIRDIINVIQRRAPGVQIVLRPTTVQGPTAAIDIARAIAELNQHSTADILIVGRGGGSAEDLWPFNEEVVARSVYASKIPVVSAVGHEIDFSICDYVADVRAPTPSAAAEIVTQEYGALRQRVADFDGRLQAAVANRLAHFQLRLDHADPPALARRLKDRLDQASQYLDERRGILVDGFDRLALANTRSFYAGALRLEGISPLAGLSRGFAYCERAVDGKPVRKAAQLQTGEQIRLRFSEGDALCNVEEVNPGSD